MNDRLQHLAALALDAHRGQTDQQGAPYSRHLIRVCNAVSTPAKPVALFHDAIEDQRLTLAQLKQELTLIEVAAVQLLTRTGEPYSDYIDRIARWPGLVGELGREVKIADLRDNLDRLTLQLERLRPRYTAALERLSYGS